MRAASSGWVMHRCGMRLPTSRGRFCAHGDEERGRAVTDLSREEVEARLAEARAQLDVTYVTAEGLRQMEAHENITPKLQRMADVWGARNWAGESAADPSESTMYGIEPGGRQ